MSGRTGLGIASWEACVKSGVVCMDIKASVSSFIERSLYPNNLLPHAAVAESALASKDPTYLHLPTPDAGQSCRGALLLDNKDGAVHRREVSRPGLCVHVTYP